MRLEWWNYSVVDESRAIAQQTASDMLDDMELLFSNGYSCKAKSFFR